MLQSLKDVRFQILTEVTIHGKSYFYDVLNKIVLHNGTFLGLSFLNFLYHQYYSVCACTLYHPLKSSSVYSNCKTAISLFLVKQLKCLCLCWPLAKLVG